MKPDDLNYKMLKLYENNSFFKVYGGDFWITLIFVVVCLLLIIYIFITNHFNKIRQNWKEERCNPLYMPFAGFINPDSGKSNAEYTNENFKYCNSQFIKKLEEDSMGPIHGFMNTINNILNGIKEAWNAIAGFMNLLKTIILNIVQMVVDKLVAVLVAIQMLFIKIKDSIGKMIGTLVASIYTFYNLYKVIKLYLLNIINITVTEILISTILALAGAIGLLIALIITYTIYMTIGGVEFSLPFGLGIPAGIASWASASSILMGNIVTISVSIAIMLIFDILIWIILVMLHNFSKQIFKDINTRPLPKRTTKIKSSDIKTTSDDSTNPMQDSKEDTN